MKSCCCSRPKLTKDVRKNARNLQILEPKVKTITSFISYSPSFVLSLCPHLPPTQPVCMKLKDPCLKWGNLYGLTCPNYSISWNCVHACIHVCIYACVWVCLCVFLAWQTTQVHFPLPTSSLTHDCHQSYSSKAEVTWPVTPTCPPHTHAHKRAHTPKSQQNSCLIQMNVKAGMATCNMSIYDTLSFI